MMYFESTPSCDLSSNPPKEKYQGGLNSRGDQNGHPFGIDMLHICNDLFLVVYYVL